MNAAKMENIGDFRNPILSQNVTQEDCCIEAQFRSIFHQAHEKLRLEGKNEASRYEVIKVLWEHYDPKMKKKEVITAVAEHLGESRRKASELKFQALRFIFKEISKAFDLEYTKKMMKAKRERAKKFKPISYRDLSGRIRKPVHQPLACTLKSSMKDYSAEEIVEMTAMYCKPFDKFRDSWFDKFLFVDPI